jgi:hypothetical protein
MSTHNTPHPLTRADWDELAKLPEVIEGWGLQGVGTLERGITLRAHGCAAAFDFVSGGPGYVGDLYILYGDALSGQPLVVYRKEDGQLAVSREE